MCSEHFETTRGLLSLTVPSLKLPRSTSQQTSRRPPPTLRYSTPSETPTHQSPAAGKVFCDACVQTDLSGSDIESMEVVVDVLKEKLKQSEQECEVEIENQRFQTSHISGNDAKVRFYTGFSTFSALLVCFNFLGPAINRLKYWSNTSSSDEETRPKSGKGRKRILPPLEEFFLLLVRLRLGLFEQDLAYRFSISQSTVSRIINTWINLLYCNLNKYPSGLLKLLLHLICLE